MHSEVRKTGVGECVTLLVMLSLTACGPDLGGLHQRSDSLGSSTLVISQVFGGGGSAGALVRNDFVELHNVSQNSVSLNGMTLQYASAAGSSWSKTDLPNDVIPAGGYYLVSLASSGSAGAALVADFSNATMNLAQSDFKLALATGASALTGSCPIYSSRVIDFVGTGTAGCYEGWDTAPSASVTRAVARLDNGCQDTDENIDDFVAAAPAARSSSSAVDTCGLVPTVATPADAGTVVDRVDAGAPTAETVDAGVSRPIRDAGIIPVDDDAGQPALVTVVDAGHAVDAGHTQTTSDAGTQNPNATDPSTNSSQAKGGGNAPSWNATTGCSSVPFSAWLPALLVLAARRQRRWPTK